ncbi:MAG: glycoside hydrolase family 32 protein [Bacteroidota bacterium]|nr:glycoside hydrolase family 32 protein [Chitinophagaceae bacterium]MDZ4808833.1 glycoside hydrolase family 32 protein [Bacteroidota bacterium]
MKNSFFVLLLCFSLNAFTQINSLYKEQFRPRFHFSPAVNWCNDPNGLVYNNGTYHLFYQHNPFGNVWGHMTWAHATSKDLVHWKHLPVAIAEEKDTMIFSGTCVVDKNNTSGFGKNGSIPMVAVYTAHIENVNQSQHIAYSLDNGITWTKYNKNPVLDLGKKDFRDPKIFWYGPKNYWVMALMFPVEHFVQFYSSKNLKDWNHLSDFGPVGDTAAVWECPDLTQVLIEGQPGKKKWVLQTSQNVSMQYFVGEFDGKTFTNENPVNKIVRPDYGPDYYAAIAWNQLPAAHLPTAIGWINNWKYANDIPTTPWKGAMSLPRTMSVKKIKNDWVLLQKPVDALKTLRSNPIEIKNTGVTSKRSLSRKTQQLEMLLSFEPSAANSGVRLAVGNNSYFEIGYDAIKQTVYIDRSKTEQTGFNKNFSSLSRFEAPVSLKSKKMQLHIFYDHSIVEVFVNDGEVVLTAQLFSSESNSGIELFSNGGRSTIVFLKMWDIKSIW